MAAKAQCRLQEDGCHSDGARKLLQGLWPGREVGASYSSIGKAPGQGLGSLGVSLKGLENS